jgi:hypothetical protein
MYNFLVTAQDGAWNETGYEYPRGRFLEYTDDDIASSFQELRAPQINTLLKLPCLFAYEGNSEPMRVGRLRKVRPRASTLYIEFEIDATEPPIPFRQIEPLQIALDIRNWELSRTHWAIKDEDLFEILAEKNLISAQPLIKKIQKNDLPALSEPELQAESVSAFIEKVLNLDHGSKEVLYRGHSIKAKYRLEPSIFRKDDRGNLKYLDAEDKIYRELLVSNSSDFQGDIYTLDRLVRMQHYSLPTRLLDITSNPLIALFFACRSNPTEVGEVIALELERDQIRYFDSDTASCIANLARLPKLSKDKIDYKKLELREFNKQQAVKRLLHFIKEEKPFFESRIRPEDLRAVICVKGKRTNDRIAFQSGAFLLFGQDATLDESGTRDIKLTRIAVKAKRDILKELDQLNINASRCSLTSKTLQNTLPRNLRFASNGDRLKESVDNTSLPSALRASPDDAGSCLGP